MAWGGVCGKRGEVGGRRQEEGGHKKNQNGGGGTLSDQGGGRWCSIHRGEEHRQRSQTSDLTSSGFPPLQLS